MATIDQTAAPEAAQVQGWNTAAHPWRRYGARAIDIGLFGTLVGVAIGFVTALLSPAATDWLDNAPRWVDGLILDPATVIVACICSGLCIARWGQTPGKWLFGIKVLGDDGERLSQGEALRRELHLFWWGLGLGITIISLIMMIRSYFELENKGQSRWDRRIGSTVYGRETDGRTWTTIAVGTLLVIGFKAWGAYATVSPMLERVGASGEASIDPE